MNPRHLLALALTLACAPAPPPRHDADLALDTSLDTSLDSLSDLSLDAPPALDTSLDTSARDVEHTPELAPDDLPAPPDLPPGEDAAPDLPTDAPEDAPDASPTPSARVVLPLGETLALDGDDYLSAWGEGRAVPVALLSRPSPEAAGLDAGGWRLTPDRAGRWLLQRGAEVVAVDVQAEGPTPATFLNYNYTPGAPLALERAGVLWVADPPSNAVQRFALSPDGVSAGPLIPTGAWPTALAWWRGGQRLLVAQTGRDSLGIVDPLAGRLVDAIPVGDEPAGVAVDEARGLAYVTLSGQRAVARVDLARGEVTGTVEVGPDPRALALDAERDRLYVASMVSSNRTPRGRLQGAPLPAETQADVAIIDLASWRRVGWILDVGATLRGLAIDPARQRLLITHSVAHNTGAGIDAEGRPHTWHLSAYTLDDPPVQLARVDLDTQPGSAGPAPDPFSVEISPYDSDIYITLAAAQRLLILDGEGFAERARLPTAHDPRGLVFDQGRAWVYGWLDTTLQGLSSDLSTVSAPVGRDPTPPEIKAGQRIFHDAGFSRHGDFACASCHPEGLTDGLVWNILLDGDVNTLSFRNVAGTGPFLWGGALPTLFDFSREVLRLVGAEANGRQMELLTRYMQSVTAPPNPYAGPGGRLSAEAEAGKALFEAPTSQGGAGCGRCHGGPLLTSRQQVFGKTPGLLTDVPSLIGLYDSGPWGRQGQWETLDEILDEALRFTGAAPSPTERAALLAWLQQAPGDLLYLNSASPLAGDDAAWREGPVELLYSSNLSPEQENLFSLREESGAPAPGRWVIEGRAARFWPEGGELRAGVGYVARVEAGLRGVFGRVAPAPLELRFRTGEGAAVDLSGRWRWSLRGAIEGDVELAFLQTRGGHAAGVLLETDAPIDFDHVEGVVSGHALRLGGFLLHSPQGDLQVERVELMLEDTDQDGYADRGHGTLETLVTLEIEAVRVALPAQP